jgi:hypothetical protein
VKKILLIVIAAMAPSIASAQHLCPIWIGGDSLKETIAEDFGLTESQAGNAIQAFLNSTWGSYQDWDYDHNYNWTGRLGFTYTEMNNGCMSEGEHDALLALPSGAVPIWFNGSTERAGWLRSTAGGWEALIVFSGGDWGEARYEFMLPGQYSRWHDRYPQYRNGSIQTNFYDGGGAGFVEAEDIYVHPVRWANIWLPEAALAPNYPGQRDASTYYCPFNDNVGSDYANMRNLNYDDYCPNVAHVPECIGCPTPDSIPPFGANHRDYDALIWAIMGSTGLSGEDAFDLVEDILTWQRFPTPPYETGELNGSPNGPSGINAFGFAEAPGEGGGGWWGPPPMKELNMMGPFLNN